MSAARVPPVPVAMSLRPALAAIAEQIPTDLASLDDVLAYRAAITHPLGAADVAERYDLTHTTTALPSGGDLTRFDSGVPTRARVLFLHGGGLLGGHRFDGVDLLARHARDLGLVVGTYEYPLAPEDRFDTMVAHAAQALAAFDDPALPLVLAGQSAGGGLAAATALAVRASGPTLAGLLLVCPMLGPARAPAADQFAHDPCWSATSNDTAWRLALAGTGRVAPLEEPDVAGMPPTYLDAGSAELFRDSIVAFATRLWAAGVRAELHVWSGAFHGSDGVVEGAAVSRESHRARREWLRRLLDGDL